MFKLEPREISNLSDVADSLGWFARHYNQFSSRSDIDTNDANPDYVSSPDIFSLTKLPDEIS